MSEKFESSQEKVDTAEVAGDENWVEAIVL